MCDFLRAPSGGFTSVGICRGRNIREGRGGGKRGQIAIYSVINADEAFACDVPKTACSPSSVDVLIGYVVLARAFGFR